MGKANDDEQQLGWAAVSITAPGSLFLVGLLHAAGNAVAGGSGFQTGYLRYLYPDSIIAVTAHLLAFALVGLAVAIATRGRLGLDPATNRSRHAQSAASRAE